MVDYKIVGNTAATQTLLFSNSLGNDWSSWDKQVEYFKKDYRVVLYHTQALDGYEIDNLCLDIIFIIKKEQLKNIHFCGISLGGLIGINLAIKFPEYFGSITVANTSPKIVTPEIWQKRIAEVKENNFLNVKEGSPSRWFTGSFIEENPSEVQKSLVGFENTKVSDYINCCHILGSTNLWENLKKIKKPFHIISGSEDPVTTEKEAREMHQIISSSKLTVLKASHLSQIEKAQDFNHALKEFIKKSL